MDTGTLAILMIFGIPMVAIWTAHRHKIAKLELESAATGTAERAAQYASQITKLEDRVQVLERIVTDRGYDVATQIEALRDTRSVEDNMTSTDADPDTGVPLNINRKEQV